MSHLSGRNHQVFSLFSRLPSHATKAAILGALSITLAAGMAQAARPNCADFFKEKLPVPAADLAAQVQESYRSSNIDAYKEIQLLKSHTQVLNGDVAFNKAINDLLVDESLSTFHDLLTQVVQKLNAKFTRGTLTSQSSAQEVKARLKTELQKAIVKFMPTRMATERAEIILSETLNKEKLMQALGRMSPEQSLEALIGRNGINNIEADSLVGRYLSQASTRGQSATSFVGKFSSQPRGTTKGEERLYLSVDSNTMELADQLFSQNPHLLIHNHEQEQGTLEMFHAGRKSTYARFDTIYENTDWISEYHVGYSVEGRRGSASKSIKLNTIAPLIVLSSIEASNTKNYLDLGTLQMPRAKLPWGLAQVKGRKTESYCRPGGYNTCTHWVGEMAIGEKQVDVLKMPGQPDGYANTSDPMATDRTAVRESPVGTYNKFTSYSGTTIDVGNTSRIDRLTRMVWREGKSNEQLWDMLGGLENHLQQGEFANPGWVVYTLLGPAKQARVPVVLVYRRDASQPINQRVLTNLKKSISAY